MQSKKVHDSSEFTDEDRHNHKSSKRTYHRRVKRTAGAMASHHHRSSVNDRAAHKHSKHCRYSHDEYVTDDMGRNSSQRSRSGTSHQRTNEPDSDSSDEILIKGRASRRFRYDHDKNVPRQSKSTDKTYRGSLRTSSSSSQEKGGRYFRDVTSSASPPFTNSRQSQSRSSNSSKSAGISASEITSHLKGITKSWLGRCSEASHKSSRRSHSRSKHEKRDKHDKKRVATSKFLVPLAQRWICYQCGKLRSDTIQQRHPLKEGQKMQPNWCGKCRVHGELHGRGLVFEKQRHYCWGCGIVRSKTYHIDNPIEDDEKSTPNYCKACREMSPAFDYNLREASDIGSVASVREKAVFRQMHEADLSDVDEEEGDQSSCAPGKENQNPKSKKKLKASNSFILANFSYKVKTTSDSSSEGEVPLSILKALHLDEERARSTSGGGCRLSDGSYQPPTVGSVSNEKRKPGLKTTNVNKEALSTINGADDRQKKDDQTTGGEEPSSPTVIFAPKQQHDNSDSSTKKKVHWIKPAKQPTTVDSNASDSAYCSGYPSDLSYKSAGSRRSRRDPGDVSTGSPPINEGESTMGDLRHDIAAHASSGRPESRGKNFGKGFGQHLPVQDTFSVPARHIDTDMASYRRASTQSSHSIPPSPLESSVPMSTCPKDFTGQYVFESPVTPWVDSLELPNFSPPNLSPTRQHSKMSPNFSRPFMSPSKHRAKFSHDSDANFYSGFGTRPGFMQEYSPYQSAAHFSDSTQTRDFSGFSAPGEAHASFQKEGFGPSVRHSDWPHADCPIYDDYGTLAEDYGGEYFSSYGDSAPFPSAGGYSAFDFSGLGGPSTSDAACGEGIAPQGEKFVRKKKTDQTTPRQHSWRLYDDGEDEQSLPDTAACKWRKDGRTTVHRSGGGKLPNEGKTVQILSIREVGSDEELAVHEDNDEASELDTVIGENSSMKSICAA